MRGSAYLPEPGLVRPWLDGTPAPAPAAVARPLSLPTPTNRPAVITPLAAATLRDLLAPAAVLALTAVLLARHLAAPAPALISRSGPNAQQGPAPAPVISSPDNKAPAGTWRHGGFTR